MVLMIVLYGLNNGNRGVAAKLFFKDQRAELSFPGRRPGGKSCNHLNMLVVHWDLLKISTVCKIYERDIFLQ